MKKTLSVFLALLMLVSTFSISSFNAMAMPKADAPRVYVGDTFEVVYDSLKQNDYEYYAKFVPDETGFYEFVLDTGVGSISGDVEVDLFNSKDEDVVSAWMDKDDRGPVTLCTQLKKGYAYYFVVVAEKCGTYKTNVTVNKHTHTMKPAVFPAIYMNIPELDLKVKENGGTYSACVTCEGDEMLLVDGEMIFSGYAVKKSTIYAPSTMTLSSTSYTYNGKKKTPTVTIKDTKGKVIDKSNYKVTYSNATNVGKATVTVEFNEKKYAGEMTKTFTIKPKKTTVASLTAKSKGFQVKWNKVTAQCDGYQVKIATNSAFSKGVKTYTVKGYRNASKTLTGLKAKQKYYVRVRTYKTVNGKKYYSDWSGYKTVTTKK